MKWQAAVVRDAYFRLRCQYLVAVAGCASKRPMPNGFAIGDYAAALSALSRFGHLISVELTALGSVCEGFRFLWRIPSAKRGLPTLQFTNMDFERPNLPAHLP